MTGDRRNGGESGWRAASKVASMMRAIDAYAFDYKADGKLAASRQQVERQLTSAFTDVEESGISISVVQTSRGWDVGQSDGNGNVWPTTSYPNATKAAARILQMMEISCAVLPQAHPERICIGSIDGEQS